MRGVLLLLLLLLLAPAVAVGQTTTTPDSEFNLRTPPPQTIPSAPRTEFPVPVPAARRPVQLFDFHPLIGVSEEYTDNFNRTVGNRQNNFRSMLSPGINVLMDAGFLTGEATYTISGFYDTAVDEPGYFNTFAGRLSWEATPRLKLNLAGGVSQNDEPSRADSLGLRQERRKFTTSNASLGADWSVGGNVTASPYYRFLHFDDESGPQTTTQFAGGNISTSIYQIHTLTVGYEYVMSTTLHATTGTSDSDLHGHRFSGSFSRDISQRMTAGVSGGYAFRTQDARGSNAETNFQLWNVSLFDNYALPKLIEFRLSIGVSKLSTERDPFVSTSSSLAYWFGQAVATVAVVRGLSETFDGGQNQGVVKTTGATGSLAYSFTPSLSGLASVAYHENEFTGVGGTPTATAVGTSPTRTERVLVGSIGLTFQIVRWLSSSLLYSYSRTTSNDVDGEIRENRVRASLNFIF
jgi:putative beta-barrel porin BBP2